MVRCRAIVDVINLPTLNGGPNYYAVEVWGDEPHDYCRKYKIFAKSDDAAAREGIERFTSEMEALEQKAS